MDTEITIALLHNHFDAAHLVSVTKEMESLGAPTVKAVWVEAHNRYVALEGCHRLRAAFALGLTPEIDIVDDLDATAESLGLDCDDGSMTVMDMIDVGHKAVELTFGYE